MAGDHGTQAIDSETESSLVCHRSLTRIVSQAIDILSCDSDLESLHGDRQAWLEINLVSDLGSDLIFNSSDPMW